MHMKAQIRNNLEREEVAKGQAVNPKEEGKNQKEQPIRKEKTLVETIHVHVAAVKNIKTAMEQYLISLSHHLFESFYKTVVISLVARFCFGFGKRLTSI